MRIATLYGDFHGIPYLLLSDACASVEDLVDQALEKMGDDDADLLNDRNDQPEEDTTLGEQSP